MSLIRGIRSLSSGYFHDFIPVPETEENIMSYVTVETNDDENCYIKFADTWPDLILLNARMIPMKIFSTAFAEKFQNGSSFGRNQIYASPLISSGSGIKNKQSFCSKIVVNFENCGEYFFGQKKENFFNKTFDEYELKFSKEDNSLFEKDFLISQKTIIERATKELGGKIKIEGTEDVFPYRVYPYAGFFEYGAHPQEIESCIFQIDSSELTSAIRIWKLSIFSSKFGINPTKNSSMEEGDKFVGVTDFLLSQKMSLYDELCSGGCQISVANKNTKEISVYKSSGVTHVTNTDLIRIIFKKEGKL